MSHYGLASQEAQEKLHQQLEHVCRNLVKVDWLREFRQPPFTPIVCLGTAIAGFLLILDFSLTPERDGSTLFQAILLLLLSLLNACLFCWEVYILKTRRIRRLLSKIEPFLNSVCPWTPLSYPSRSISTLRDHFTVHAHRDGKIVNLPTSLLVQGDVIELYQGIPLPASATLLDSDCVATNTHIEMGDFPPPELFQTNGRGRSICFVDEAKRVKFLVTQTPVIAVFLTTLQKRRATSVLTQEKTYVLLGKNVFCLITLSLSFFFNLIRYTSLTDDVGFWTEMLLQLQVYTVLPLLQLLLPSVWTLMNLYGTAKIVLLTEKGPVTNATMYGNFQTKLKTTLDILKKMVVLIRYPSRYPNYRVFHILGSLTSLCSIDKEYVLTDSTPVPEKVFFLTRGKSPEQMHQNKGEPLDKKKVAVSTFQEREAVLEEMVENTSIHEEGRDTEPLIEEKGQAGDPRIHVRVCTPEEGNEKQVHVIAETASTDGNLERNKFPAAGFMRADSDPLVLTSTVARSATEEVQEDPHNVGDMPNPKKKPSRFLSLDSATLSTPSQVTRTPVHENGYINENGSRLSQALTGSSISLSSPFELVGEILDLSPNSNTLSGLGFDDINWEDFLGSLKPIGVNCLATSHILRDPYSWSPNSCSEYVRSDLCKTNCMCSLGIEIGVNEYLQGFTNEVLLFSVSDLTLRDENVISRRPSASLLTENAIQPHILSSVLKDKSSGNYLVMSRGSGDMVAACCSDFWDGKDLQPMTSIERDEIATFFARRHLTSYCVTLAYNPLVDSDLSSLLKQNIALYVPIENIQKTFEGIKDQLHSQTMISCSGEQIFSSLLCNQVFLGVVSLQFQPKADIVSLIEDLESTGIRFVYFTNENEVRAKVFAEKLGLEAGWNCHISLAPGGEDDDIVSSNNEQEFASCSSSTSSSLNSVINAFQSYIRAKLPKGINNIRPHLKNVDNVPLLVPLFTDCTVDAIREMIQIMQENGEVVMCLGNAWNRNNLSIFAQADISLSIIPESANLHCCLDAKESDETLSTSVSNNNFGNPPQQIDPNRPVWPTPLEMASYLNTAVCQLCVHRQSNISILELVTESRHTMSCIRHGLLFGLGSSVSITILMLASTLLFLPPPLSGGHIFWFLLITIPILVLSFLSTNLDPKIKTLMPSRKKRVLNEKFLGLCHFCFTFLPTALLTLLLFALTLGSLCSQSTVNGEPDCHPLLGDRNESSLWNGWRGVNEQGLLLAQDVTALFFSIHLATHSVRFIHRTAPIWQLYKFVSWPYITTASIVVVLQIIYFAISQNLATNTHRHSASYGLASIPPYVWVVGIFWCVPLLCFHELLKYQDRKLVLKLQRHLKLEFETKLGMNSPF